MKVIKITDKKQLNEFVAGQKTSQFLQSWQWGVFQEKVGNKIIRLGVYDNNQRVTAATIIKKTLPMGKSYFYCPRGPVLIINYQLSIINFLFNEIEKIAKEERVIFLRLEPERQLKIKNYELKIIKTLDVQPSKTLILDLNKTEGEILKDMHQKTRYNIRLADNKGVKVIEAGQGKFNEFWEIMRETNKRDKFRLHPRNYYREMLLADNMRLLVAEYKKKIIAGIIVSFFGDTGVYVHGASSNKYRNVMAPYLLQWTAISIARRKGCKYYDLNGIDEDKWPGVTRFKKGFGGQETKYPGTFDLVFNNPWYNIYKIMRKIRRII